MTRDTRPTQDSELRNLPCSRIRPASREKELFELFQTVPLIRKPCERVGVDPAKVLLVRGDFACKPLVDGNLPAFGGSYKLPLLPVRELGQTKDFGYDYLGAFRKSLAKNRNAVSDHGELEV